MDRYNDIEGHMTDQVLSNHPTLVEQSMDHVDTDGLKDGPYYPNVTGFNYYY